MPAAVEPKEASKTEREELMWRALKEHIMLERQKKKEEQAAEVEEERLRKEREARDRQDAMTLGETREQIQLLNIRLEELRNEKQQLFLRLKKVLNEDENRKRQQQQKDSEMFALQNIGPQPRIFLPPRFIHELMQKGGSPVIAPPPPAKRSRSPSPTQCYYKTNNPSFSSVPKHEDGRRGGEMSRNVLWNKPTYQNPSGTLYYPTTVPDSRGPSITYPTYPPHMPTPMRPTYHVEIPPPPPQTQSIQSSLTPSTSSVQSSHQSHIKADTKVSQGAQVYHINLDQQQQQQQQQASQLAQQQHHQQQPPPPPHLIKPQPQQQQQQQPHHKPHMSGQPMQLDKSGIERGYHLEIKHDDRKDRIIQSHSTQMQQVPPSHQSQVQVTSVSGPPPPSAQQYPGVPSGIPPPGLLNENIVYAHVRPNISQIHPAVSGSAFSNQPQPQNSKPSGSITQGYANRQPPPQPPPGAQRHFYYM